MSMAMQRAVAVIPARGGSKRLPRKNVHPVRGVPLLAYTIQAALASKSIESVAVSTEDAEIAEVAQLWGARVIERPIEFAQDGSAIDDVLRHAVGSYRAQGIEPGILVWLQADVPLRREGLIDEIVEMMRGDTSLSAVATAFKVTQHPDVMKVVDEHGLLRPVEPSVTAYRMQDLSERFLLDGAVVAIRPDNLFAYTRPGLHRYLGPRAKMAVQDHPMYSLNVETPEEVELAEFYLERYPRYRLEPLTTDVMSRK